MTDINQNQNESVKSSAKTVELAIEQGLSQLNLTQNDVEIEVVKEGKSGFLGIGAEDAVVVLTPVNNLEQETNLVTENLPEPQHTTNGDSSNGDSVVKHQPSPVTPQQDTSNIAADTDDNTESEEIDSELMEKAKTILENILAYMSVKGNVSVRIGEDLVEEGERAPLTLDITGPDLGLLIGRRGETLQALQFIIRQILSKEAGRWLPLVVDVESYLVRRRKSLKQLAKRMADKVVFSRRKVVLEPMTAGERRIIHLQLRNHKQVYTSSVGEKDRRKVVILPK